MQRVTRWCPLRTLQRPCGGIRAGGPRRWGQSPPRISRPSTRLKSSGVGSKTPPPRGLDLIRRARSGDREAFDALARSHEGALRGILTCHLGPGLRGRVEVDDLLQDTLLRAFRSMEQFRGESNDAFRSWITVIAQHVVVDRGRKLLAEKADYRREVPLEASRATDSSGSGRRAADAQAPQASPSRILRREERLERLLEAIHQLSPDHRKVILLTLVERLQAREVAQQMERSDKAVSMLLLRAMRALREIFGDTSSLTLPRDFPAQARAAADGGT